MPIIKSAIKRMRQTVKRRARNLTTKRNMRTALKDFAGDKTAQNLSKAQSHIDTAVKKNIMTKNTAARKKAQLARQAKEASTAAIAPVKKAVKAKATTAAKTTAKKAAAPKKKPTAKKTVAKKADK